jgi:ATP-dependent exoDNAse (exonuclease V) beta subunit
MNTQINDFIKNQESAKYATNAGLLMHAKLQTVFLGAHPMGDAELISKINSSAPELQMFFSDKSKAEVPLAGFINGHFISRRIDRLLVNDVDKTVHALDYKTDLDSNKFRQKYIAQIHEYMELLAQIYPKYKISGCILWLHDWRLESV